MKESIHDHAEFNAFHSANTALFEQWRKASTPKLKGIKVGAHPKALIEELSESLLSTFTDAPLLDAYDVYQHLMDAWEATLQDDVHQIVVEGWQPVLEGKPNADLIPPALVVGRYFASEQAALEQIEADRDALRRLIRTTFSTWASRPPLVMSESTDEPHHRAPL